MNTSNQTVPEKAMFSLFSGDNPELVANPFALFAQMRSVGAVMPLPLPFAGTDRQVWAVTRMEEAVQILKDHAHFTVDPRPIGINSPCDDLISQLIAIEEEGDRLSETELLSMITLLIFAGHETTSNLIATGTLMLLDHPAQLAKLKADLSLVPTAVEELLRFNGPATIAGPRFATEDIELAGQQIKQGDMLFPILGSANRDESQFTQPEELDIARTLNHHLAFGHGIHTCLGAPLARLEGDIALTTLLGRMPNLQLSVPRESITWHFSLNSRSLAALPVAF